MKNLMIFLTLLFLTGCGGATITEPTDQPVNIPKANFDKPKEEILVIDFRDDASIVDMIKRQGAVTPIKFRSLKLKKRAEQNCKVRQARARKNKFQWDDINYRILGQHPTKNVWLCVPDKINKFQMKQNCQKMKMELYKYDNKTNHTFSCVRRENN